MTRSPAYRERLVQEIYQDLLDRPANRQDLRKAVHLLEAGGSVQQLRAHLAGSSEYLRRNHGTTSGFITALFDDFLDRSPTAAERALWSRQLLQRTWFVHGISEPTAVAEALGEMREAKRELVDEVFKQYLHRSASPHELRRFVRALNHGMRYERVVAKVVGAKEYFAWYKDSDPFNVNVILDQPNAVEALITQQDGHDLHLDSVFLDGATLTFYLAHFSGVGAGAGTLADANGRFEVEHFTLQGEGGLPANSFEMQTRFFRIQHRRLELRFHP